MGIKGLWTVLTPFSEKKSLHEIRGETLAVDLSGWVCDSQNVTEYHVQPKLYLRNLFFRTIYLLLADITPIFVLEGDAPQLKQNVMAARNAIQFRGAAPKSDYATTKRPDVTRRRFAGVLREVCIKDGVYTVKLFSSAWVCAASREEERRRQHARTSMHKLVDAVISQDSDCFAYGARRVYRNFSVSSSAGGGAMQGSVDCYDAAKMFESNGFGRKKMVALALLCGCDYGVGACGTSINTVVAFLHSVPESEVIPRLLSWVTDVGHYEERARWAAAPGRCNRCGHVGRTHLKNGCPVCATHKGCNEYGHKAKVAEVKRELSLRARALSCGMLFPEPKVMKEFLNTVPEKIDLNNLKKPAPSLIQFVKVMSTKLDWGERYCVEKFLPLLTKWHLQENVPCRTIKPISIKKKRNPKGVPSFEVVWADIEGQYDALIPDDQYNDDEDRSDSWTSIERQDLMRQFYPNLVHAYEESIKKPPKEKKTRGRKKKEDTEKPKRKYNRKPKNIDVENLNDSMKSLELNSSKANVSVSVNKLKRKIKKTTKKGSQKTLESFIEKKRKKSNNDLMISLRHSLRNMSLVHDSPKLDSNDKENRRTTKNWLSILGKSVNDENESDLSDIIERMVSKPPVTKTANVNNKLVRLVFDNYSTPKKLRNNVSSEILNHCSTPNDSPKRPVFDLKSGVNSSFNNSGIHNVNTSFFFDKLTDDRDAFEMSLGHKSAIINLDATVDYSLPDVIL